MRWLLRRCRKCGRYTLRRDRCPVCGGELYVPHPPRFSPEDRYVKYRYMMKILAGLVERPKEDSENSAHAPRSGEESAQSSTATT